MAFGNSVESFLDCADVLDELFDGLDIFKPVVFVVVDKVAEFFMSLVKASVVCFAVL